MNDAKKNLQLGYKNHLCLPILDYYAFIGFTIDNQSQCCDGVNYLKVHSRRKPSAVM